MISKTFQGYAISKRIRGSEFSLYVKSIYRGKITWTTDYTYAKWYTEKTAKRLDAAIDEGIRNGEFDNDILADTEVQEIPEVVEEVAEEQKPEAREFFWNDEVKDIDKAMKHMLDCIARFSATTTEYSDPDAVEYFKSEYIRLGEVRAKAAKKWLAVW